MYFCIVSPIADATSSDSIVVYSARKPHLIQPILDAFTKQTHIKTELLSGEAPVLLQRILAEGKSTPADILLTVDSGNLWHAAEQNIFTPIESQDIANLVPKHLRDSSMRWTGLTVRARTMVYNNEKIKPEQLSTYSNLSDPQWNKKLCLRTAKKVYNQSLVAMLIHHNTEPTVESTVRSWVDNLAAPVFASDTNVIKAIESGQCDVGIINTYYYGRYLALNPKTKVKLHWANQNSTGVHINITGAGIIKYSSKKEKALKLIEYLTSPAAQSAFSKTNFEFPVNPNVNLDPSLAKWGIPKMDVTPLVRAGELQAQAIRLMDRAGYL